MSKTKLLLVDDHAVLRAGLKMLLNSQTDMEVVGEAADGTEALQQVQKLRPDMVIIDLTMSPMGGDEATRLIKDENPNIKIVVLTVHDDEYYLRRALRCGADGFVPKKAADTDLLSAIRATRKGEKFIHSSLSGILVNTLLEGEERGMRKSRDDILSQREREVLRLLALGYTNKEIAQKLFLSIKSVETYKARLMDKLNIRGRAELVRYAIQKHLLDI